MVVFIRYERGVRPKLSSFLDAAEVGYHRTTVRRHSRNPAKVVCSLYFRSDAFRASAGRVV